MARRTKEQALETRELLLDTAERLFHEKGVSRTSLADIADAAGLTRGAIYWHFKNKSDLFNSMFDRVRLPMEELITASLDENEVDPLGRVRELLVHCLCQTALDARRRRVLDVYFNKCELTEEMGLFMLRLQETLTEGRDRLERGLRNAVTRQQLPAGLDVRRAAILIHANIGGLLREWLIFPDGFDLERDAGCFVDAVLDMARHGTALLPPATVPTALAK